MRLIPYFPTTFAALVGLVAATSAVCLSSPPAHARHLPLAVRPVGDAKTETRALAADCHGIALNAADNVIVKQGSTPGITLSGPADELARTETVVERGRLIIRKTGTTKTTWSKSDEVIITVTLTTIESLSVNGSGDMRTEGTITGADLALAIAGSGDLHVAAALSGTCSTSIAGSGDAQLSGRCATHAVRLAGSGNIEAARLLATNATVKLSGSGDVSVAAADALNVTISGSGDVRYAGSPKQLAQRVTGSGSVAKL